MTLRIDPADRQGIEHHLARQGWIPAGARVARVERAGEGNMNLVLRLVIDGGGAPSVILKQSRPWVEKYPQIAAPEQRLLVEVDFYRAVARVPEVAARLPRLVHVDPENLIAIFEDLGPAADYVDVYRGRRLGAEEESALLAWLGALHRAALDPADWPALGNRAMRALNHAHLFVIPLEPDNGVDLDAIEPGLEAAAAPIRADRALRAAMLELGERYLADGDTLLHGDFYPGSWLATEAGPRVIDAEFAFFGEPEFDVGVYLGHRLLAGAGVDGARAALERYRAPGAFSDSLAWAYAGVEVLRRLLGVAQLPLAAGLEPRAELLELGRALVVQRDGTSR